MAKPRKSDKAYPGYLADQDRKPFVPSAREEELLSKTVHPDELEELRKDLIKIISRRTKEIDVIDERLETLEVRFNELCNMLSVQLANSSFKLLEIRDAKK